MKQEKSSVTLQIENDVLVWLEDAAKANMRSRSAQIRYILRKVMEAKGE